MDLLQIAQLIALLSASALCIYLIIVLLRVKEILSNVERELKNIATHAIPILENTEYITSRMKSVAENIDDQVMTVRDSLASMKQIADNVVELERKVQERIEGPILDGVSFVAAILKGVRTFTQRVRS